MNIEPSFDTWTSLFLIVALHGVMLAILFFSRKAGRKLPNILLGIFLLLFSLQLVDYVLYWTRYNLAVPHLLGISGPFHFLYGPILYLYALNVLKPHRKLKIWDIAHFIPFIIFLIWGLPFFLQTAAEKMDILISMNPVNVTGYSVTALIVVAIKVFLMVTYGLAVLFMHKPAFQFVDIDENRLTPPISQWLQGIGYIFLGYVFSYALYFILVETINFKIEHDYMVSFAMSAFIFGIGYMGLFKPSFLEEAHNGKFKYETSSLSSDEAETYLEKLLSYMEEKKPYIDGDLKLVDLSEQASIPSHHLSRIINERLGKNFFEFVNSYRIEEAKKVFADPQKRDFKVLRVALESGFNNKTSFNNVFKKEVGMTPSEFRKHEMNGA